MNAITRARSRGLHCLHINCFDCKKKVGVWIGRCQSKTRADRTCSVNLLVASVAFVELTITLARVAVSTSRAGQNENFLVILLYHNS